MTISVGEATEQVRAVRLGDHRVAAPVPPSLADLLAAEDVVEVDVVLEDDDVTTDTRAEATIVRSGRAWTEARGRLRESYGWARRFVRSPAEIVLLVVAEG